jgi:hypothetical protein
MKNKESTQVLAVLYRFISAFGLLLFVGTRQHADALLLQRIPIFPTTNSHLQLGLYQCHNDRSYGGSNLHENLLYRPRHGGSIMYQQLRPRTTRLRATTSFESTSISLPFAPAGSRVSPGLSSTIDEILQLYQPGRVREALRLFNEATQKSVEEEIDNDDQADSSQSLSTVETLTNLLIALSKMNDEIANTPDVASMEERIELMQAIYQRCKEQSPSVFPTRIATNAVLASWSKSYLPRAGEASIELLNELWMQYHMAVASARLEREATDSNGASIGSDDSLHDSADVQPYCPTLSSYVWTLTSLSRCEGGRPAAERAEELLEEMELHSKAHVHLKPTTCCVNLVL